MVPEETQERPQLVVGEPDYAPGDQQNALVSEYMLTYPVTLIMPVPGGRKRQQVKGAAIMRALQEEWRSGFGLGMSGLVVDSHVGEAEAVAEDEDNLPGYRSSIPVQLYETHAARSF